MQDFHLFGSHQTTKSKPLKNGGKLEAMINPHEIQPLQSTKSKSKLVNLKNINAIRHKTLEAAINKCEKPNQFTFFKIMTFDHGKVQIKVVEDYKHLKALYLTCGHAVDEYQNEAPVQKFTDSNANQQQVILNMGMFAGERMKDPISGVWYPICIEAAVLAQFYSNFEVSEEQEENKTEQSIQEQQENEELQQQHDREQSKEQSKQRKEKVMNFKNPADYLRQQQWTQLQTQPHNLQPIEELPYLDSVTFTPWPSKLQDIQEMNLIGYVGEVQDVTKELEKEQKFRKTLLSYWPSVKSDIKDLMQSNENLEYQELLKQKALELRDQLLKLGCNLCHSSGKLKTYNSDIMAINLSSVQGQSGSPIFCELNFDQKILMFCGIHISGPLDANEFDDFINKYIQVYVEDQQAQISDKRYNLALSVKSTQLEAIFQGVSKLAHLSQQPEKVKKIWVTYLKENPPPDQEMKSFQSVTEFKDQIFKQANHYKLTVHLNQNDKDFFNLKQATKFILQVVKPTFQVSKGSVIDLTSIKKMDQKQEQQFEPQIKKKKKVEEKPEPAENKAKKYENFSKLQREKEYSRDIKLEQSFTLRCKEGNIIANCIQFQMKRDDYGVAKIYFEHEPSTLTQIACFDLKKVSTFEWNEEKNQCRINLIQISKTLRRMKKEQQIVQNK